MYISTGASADHGRQRLRSLKIATAITTVTLGAFVLIPSVWWLGAVLYCVANIAFGAAYVFYNAALPLMAHASDEFRATPTMDVLERESSNMSALGFAYGMWPSEVYVAVVKGIVQTLRSGASCLCGKTRLPRILFRGTSQRRFFVAVRKIACWFPRASILVKPDAHRAHCLSDWDCNTTVRLIHSSKVGVEHCCSV